MTELSVNSVLVLSRDPSRIFNPCRVGKNILVASGTGETNCRQPRSVSVLTGLNIQAPVKMPLVRADSGSLTLRRHDSPLSPHLRISIFLPKPRGALQTTAPASSTFLFIGIPGDPFWDGPEAEVLVSDDDKTGGIEILWTIAERQLRFTQDSSEIEPTGYCCQNRCHLTLFGRKTAMHSTLGLQQRCKYSRQKERANQLAVQAARFH